MLPKIITVVSVPFQENTHILHWEGRADCIVFDPGLEPHKILAALEQHQLTPAAILITHGHGDHIAGIPALKKRWPACPVVIGITEAPKLLDPELNLSASFGLPFSCSAADETLQEGDVYSAAGFDFEILDLPGHSLGHIAFICKQTTPFLAFVGDVLFAGSVGRTDIPDGDFQLLIQGIRRKLFILPDETLVVSGHGPVTTIGREKKSNPFVGEKAGSRGNF